MKKQFSLITAFFLALAALFFVILSLPKSAHAGTIELPETGQTTCYNASGTVIDCPGTGQDGEIKAGVSWPSPRFTDNGDGTVTDNLTGLVWLKDANCIKTSYTTYGTDGAVAWQEALDFVAGINAGTYSSCGAGKTDWRLPNVNELESLMNAGESNSATWLNTQGFTNVQSDFYWSGSSYADRGYGGSTYYAWGVSMGGDVYGRYVIGSSTSNNNDVWPVRSGQ